MKNKTTIMTLSLFALLGLAFAAATPAAQPCINLACTEPSPYNVRNIISKMGLHQASVSEVIRHASEYDGIYVQITGQVVSIEQKPSRFGAFYRVFTLSEPNAATREPGETLKVYSFNWPDLTMGDTVVVEGTYRTDYWFGGWPIENFISAETIFRGSSL